MGPLREIPLVAWCFLVGLPLLRFVLRRRQSTPQPSAFKENVREVNDSLVELHKPLEVPTVQVLFFHGLPLGKFSSVHLSTRQCGDGSSNIWPQTWLVEDFPGAHVFSVRYSEGLRKDSVERFDRKFVGENLLSDLIQGNIGQVHGCPVMLVGHCIWGLVIKQLCLEAHVTRGLNEVPRQKTQLENFLNRIKGYSITQHLITTFLTSLKQLTSLRNSPFVQVL